MKDLPVPPDDLLELFDIDPAATALPESARPEPVLAAPPLFGEFAEPERLDPERAIAEPAELPPGRRQRRLPVGLAGSLGVHLLPLLVLLHGSSAPPEIAAAIPVQLVLETPPAAPAPAETPPPPGRLASEDIGETARPAIEAAAPAPVLVAPPPPKPVPPPERPAAEPLPKLAAAAPALQRPEPMPQQPAREARVPGPAATRDEYLAYLVTLTRRHLDMLPLNLVGGRRGETILGILVLDDGTIARISVAHGSGYPDIDARIEKMVIAVGRFPPLPQWFQGPSMELNLRLRFPEALEK